MSVDNASVITLMPMRDDDLRSARYLDVANHPKMTYRAQGSRTAGEWSVMGA